MIWRLAGQEQSNHYGYMKFKKPIVYLKNILITACAYVVLQLFLRAEFPASFLDLAGELIEGVFFALILVLVMEFFDQGVDKNQN